METSVQGMSAVVAPSDVEHRGDPDHSYRNKARPTPLQWIKANLFSSPFNTLLTLLSAAFLIWAIPPAFNWLFLNAVWGNQPVEACDAVRGRGACWAVVSEKFRFMMFGTYPYEEQWRPAVAIVVLVSLLVISALKRFWKPSLIVFWVVGIALTFWLMSGGIGLSSVRSGQWGGLPVTLILSIFGIAF